MDRNQEDIIKKAPNLLRHLEFLQYSYFDGRPEWTTIKNHDLKLFMAYTYYDYPLSDEYNNNLKDIGNENVNDIFMLYKNELQVYIINTIKKIEEFIQPNYQSSSFEVGVTIIHSICKTKCKLYNATNACCSTPEKIITHQWKLIRIKVNRQVFFVDFLFGKTYNNWNDYIENNTLPEGNIIYPKSGFYDETISLIPCSTPASRRRKQFLKKAPIQEVASVLVGFSIVWKTVSDLQNVVDILRQEHCLSASQLELGKSMDKKSEPRWKDVLSLRLDLFIITGSLAPIKDLKNIIIGMSSEDVWLPIFKTMETFPYYLSQHFWKSVYFFKMHSGVFAERVMMFLSGKLTLGNLLFTWQKIYRLMNVYQKQITALDVSDLLWHVVDGVEADEIEKDMLRDRCLTKLLDGLRRGAAESPSTHSAQVKYCVDRVMREATKLCVLHDDSAAELARLGETSSKVDEEFCAMFGLEKCDMGQYIKWAISEVGRNPTALLAEYREHASLPENKFDDQLLVSITFDNNRSVKAYSLLAPCNALDAEMCVRFANTLNPQPHGYRKHEFVQSPDADVSFLMLSNEIVFYGVDLFDGVPKLDVCFYGCPGPYP